ncbi:hypothetical protein THAPSDRAFT_1487 [Thalassiosira pseudonana CCMP1335]|uniref:PPPDE domain-containing protein n=1 Tax=Thalassiosira pseudonana TaxID=35128 RepID=B8BR33_THAPS|nr:hypothetical protein THAPSDRAFT_1487 [Thalassiosira pseudonana CCMP1335]EED96461.1 hypothetical protein THAPSDRAFT_1487 [Thalassiosira pseudonana CCMP1335]|eukprot:scaffold5185_cov198-Alexandrium_tamarense.AAC.21
MDNVVLNIYDLAPASSQQDGSSQPQAPTFPSFFSSVLSPLGMGAYHTSIDIRGFRYQFGASVGITRTSSPQGGGETAESRRFVPSNGSFRESLILGQTWLERGEINAIVQRMRDDKFTGDKYHLVNRNCNHFSETFAMALILGNELLENNNNNLRLEKYPAYVNRLAKTATAIGIDDGNICNVIEEARVAAGVRDKVGWNLSQSSSQKSTASSSVGNRSQKKVLTEKQKAALAKVKTSSNK